MTAVDARASLPPRVGSFLRRHAVLLTLGASVLLFSVLTAELLVLRYLAFDTAAWDLGNYNQAFYTTVTGHAWFYYTADLPSGNGGYLFAAHPSFDLILLLPIYAAAPSPETLLVVEAVAAALAAIPLFYFARAELRSERWGLGFALLFLASPILLGIVWYDFHPEALLPLGILCTIWAYRARRWKAFLATWVFTLFVIETAAPLLLIFLVAAVVSDYVHRGRPWKEVVRGIPTAVWLALGVALVTLVLLSGLVPGVLAAHDAYGLSYGEDFRILGAADIPSVLPTALLHPGSAWAALSFQSGDKAAYVLLLLLSLGFLPLFGRWRYLLPGLAWVALAVLSNNHGYYSFGDQYAAYVYPFWMAGAVVGLGRIRRWVVSRSVGAPSTAPPRSSPRTTRRKARSVWRAPFRVDAGRTEAVAVVLLLVGLGVGVATVSPLNANPSDSLAVPHGFPVVTAHDQLLREIVGLIPPGAGVLTTLYLFPQVSDRVHAYVLPIASYFAGNLTFVEALDRYVNESAYLLYDVTSDPYSAGLFQYLANFTGFGVVAEADGIVLLERGYSGPPALWSPDMLLLPGGQLAVAPAVARGLGGNPDVLQYSGTASGPTRIWAGPGVSLSPGSYRVTFNYSLSGGTSGAPPLEIQVGSETVRYAIVPTNVGPTGHDYSITRIDAANSTSLVNVSVASSAGGAPETLVLNFTWVAPALLDLEGWARGSNVTVDLYNVSVTQTSVA